MTNAACGDDQRRTRRFTMTHAASLSVVDEKGLSEVADAVAVEGTTCWAIRYVPDIVQVVGASAVVALGVAACPKHQGLCNVVVLVAV